MDGKVILFASICAVCTGAVAASSRHLRDTADEDCKDGYIWLGGSYDCSNLLDESNQLGFYHRRDHYCKQPTTDCCQTCLLAAQMALTSNSVDTSGLSTDTDPVIVDNTDGSVVYTAVPNNDDQPSQGNSDTTDPDGDEECKDDYIWLGGSYDCSNLLDESNQLGFYDRRYEYCNTSSTDCCRTCRLVALMAQTSNSDQSTQENSDTTESDDTDCQDDYIWLDGSYNCSHLLDESNLFGFYQQRDTWCNNSNTQCCHTCLLVAQMKAAEATPVDQPSSNSTGHDDENNVDLDTTASKKPPKPDTTSTPNLNTQAPSSQDDTAKSSHDVTESSNQDKALSGIQDSVAKPSLPLAEFEVAIEKCVDDRLLLGNVHYPCRALLHPVFGDVFSSRDQHCIDHVASCCVTCRRLQKIAVTMKKFTVQK